MTNEAMGPAPERGSPPKGLIAMTVLFAVLAAAAVAALVHMGESRSAESSSRQLEEQAIEVPREALSRQE